MRKGSFLLVAVLDMVVLPEVGLRLGRRTPADPAEQGFEGFPARVLGVLAVRVQLRPRRVVPASEGSFVISEGKLSGPYSLECQGAELGGWRVAVQLADGPQRGLDLLGF